MTPSRQFARDLAPGYAAGMNRYLRETGRGEPPRGRRRLSRCRLGL